MTELLNLKKEVRKTEAEYDRLELERNAEKDKGLSSVANLEKQIEQMITKTELAKLGITGEVRRHFGFWQWKVRFCNTRSDYFRQRKERSFRV